MTIYMGNSCLHATDDVFDGDLFMLSFPTGCPRWDLGFLIASVPEKFPTYVW